MDGWEPFWLCFWFWVVFFFCWLVVKWIKRYQWKQVIDLDVWNLLLQINLLLQKVLLHLVVVVYSYYICTVPILCLFFFNVWKETWKLVLVWTLVWFVLGQSCATEKRKLIQTFTERFLCRSEVINEIREGWRSPLTFPARIKEAPLISFKMKSALPLLQIK